MAAAKGTPRGVASVRVLDADRDLAGVLDDRQAEAARRALVAPVVTLAKGDWSPPRSAPTGASQLGLLVTEGILCRQVAIGDTVCAELVGPGDLLRPWEGAGNGLLLCDVRWQVLDRVQLAVLGSSFVTAAARWPALTSALVGRTVGRAHALALSATISCTTGLETRLRMLFWHLADRWGKVRRDGVIVPVPMTHALIGMLINARRPSVSTALKQLEREGEVRRLQCGGWLLAGDPPRPFDRAKPACLSDLERPPAHTGVAARRADHGEHDLPPVDGTAAASPRTRPVRRG